MPYIKINRKIINVDDYKCPICGDPVEYSTDWRRKQVKVWCAKSRDQNVVRAHFRALFPLAVPESLRVTPPGPGGFDFYKEYGIETRRPHPREGSRRTPAVRGKSDKIRRRARRS